MTNITIIGGGVSGVFLAIQLIRQKTKLPLNITVIEKENEPWLGAAYSTDKPFHLLNVRASRMSALAGEDNHFLLWLNENGYAIGADDFAPRAVFRKYVEDVFQKTMAEKPSNISFQFVRGQAVHIEPVNEYKAVVHLKDQQKFRSDFIVLALGNFTSNSSLTEDPALRANSSYYDNPWARNVLDNLKRSASVLILGTGPTMIDTVLTLYYQKHQGRITALSRHGLLPAKHILSKIYPDFSDEMKDVVSLSEAVGIVRKHIAIAEKNGTGWRAVIDSMRPFTQELWMNISTQGKIDFLKYYKTYWEVSRSRMPDECATVIYEMINSGTLMVIAGRINAFEKRSSRIAVNYATAGQSHTILADGVINCMGPGLNFERIKDPLVESLIKQGMVCNSEAGVGVNALPDGTIIKKDGRRSGNMYTLGSPLRGVLWETVAIPELRVQAKELAASIIKG